MQPGDVDVPSDDPSEDGILNDDGSITYPDGSVVYPDGSSDSNDYETGSADGDGNVQDDPDEVIN